MRIVVTCDFTPVVDSAVHHAANIFLRQPGTEIILLHVVPKGLKAKTEAWTKVHNRLESLAESYTKRFGPKMGYALCEGEIWNTIAEYAEMADADLIIMGTHGITGLQSILVGSKAIRVITHSNVPFLVVQKEPQTDSPFKHIVMPLGPRAEERETIEWGVKLAQENGARMHVLTPNYSDSRLGAKCATNVSHMHRRFQSCGIFYDLEEASRYADFAGEVKRYASSVNGDLILLMITQTVGGLSPILNSTDQRIIANEQGIPVLCVNPSMV